LKTWSSAVSRATEKPRLLNSEASSDLTGGSPAGISDTGTVADAFSLSIPKIGAYRTEKHQYYWNGKGPYPSVTTILDVMDKPALVSWAKRTVAEIAVNRWEEVGAYIQRDSPDAAIQWLKGLPDYQRDAAGKLGTSIHLWADIASRGQEPDGETFQPSEEERPYLEAYRRFSVFLGAEGSRIVSSEKMVWSQDGYGGTYDMLVKRWCDPCRSPGTPHTDPYYHHSYCQYRREGSTCSCEEGKKGWDRCEHEELWLLDLKTAKTGPYPEWALQLIAYGTADFIIIEDDPTPYPMPVIERYGVLHLRPDLYTDTGWRLIEYPLIPSDRMAFLGALEIWRWKQEKRYTKHQLLSTST
jgi:hypothetical protein